MPCSNTLYTVSGVFHGLTILVALICSLIVISNISNNKPSGILIPIVFIIIFLIRLPNQICVAFDDNHGWFSVATTILSILIFIGVIGIIIYKKKHNVVNHISNKHPTLYAGTAPSSNTHRTQPYTRYVKIKNDQSVSPQTCDNTESGQDSSCNQDSHQEREQNDDSSLSVDVDIEFESGLETDSDSDSDEENVYFA